MIWDGKTFEQKMELRYAWQYYFAWWPTQLSTGKWIFWKHYEARLQNRQSKYITWVKRPLGSTIFEPMTTRPAPPKPMVRAKNF